MESDWSLSAKIHNDLENPEMDHKRLFYYDVLECNSFMFTRVEDRICIQLQLLTIFLKGGGLLCV